MKEFVLSALMTLNRWILRLADWVAPSNWRGTPWDSTPWD